LHETYFWACVISRESLKRKERKGFFFFFFLELGGKMGVNYGAWRSWLSSVTLLLSCHFWAFGWPVVTGEIEEWIVLGAICAIENVKRVWPLGFWLSEWAVIFKRMINETLLHKSSLVYHLSLNFNSVQLGSYFKV
jgi:hypothetical protein